MYPPPHMTYMGFFMGIIKRFKEQVVASDPVLTTQTYAGLPYLNLSSSSYDIHVSSSSYDR
jgi:hypothetical protein